MRTPDLFLFGIGSVNSKFSFDEIVVALDSVFLGVSAFLEESVFFEDSDFLDEDSFLIFSSLVNVLRSFF